MTLPAHLHSRWFVACLSAQLGRRPLARTVLGRPLVLFRDGEGRPAALLDRCPHRNAPLSQGRMVGEQLACPYHGWQFDRAGHCRAIPGRLDSAPHAAACVPSFAVVEEPPLIWVRIAPQSIPVDPPREHLLGSAGYTTVARAFALEAPLLDALENFLDPTHTHFVHAGLVRTARRKSVRVTVRRLADRVEAEYSDEQQSGLIARLFGRHFTHSVGRFLLPATVVLEYHSGPRIEARIVLYFTPEDDDRSQVFAVLAARVPAWLGRPLSVPLGWMLERVVSQDRRILAMQKGNVERFGGAEYVSTELDLVRPSIARLLADGSLPAESVGEKSLTLFL